MRRRLATRHNPFSRLRGYRPRLERLEDRTLPSVSPVLHLPLANPHLSGLTRSPQAQPVVTITMPTITESTFVPPGLLAHSDAARDLAVVQPGENTVLQLSVAFDGTPKFNLTVTADPASGTWSFALTINPGQGTANGAAGKTDNPLAGAGQTPTQTNTPADVLNTANNTSTGPQATPNGGLLGTFTGQQQPGQGNTTPTPFGQQNEALERLVNPQPVVIVIVPVLVVNEAPVLAALDVVGPVLPPAPSIPTVAPVLPTLQTATRIESGGGDNLPLPDPRQESEQLFYWLINNWWVQQPGPAVSGDAAGMLPSSGAAVDVAALAQVAEGALVSGEERVTEKKAPEPTPETDGPGLDRVEERSLAGAAVLAAVLGGYWGQYVEEEDDETRRLSSSR
jgi:hypothetical protein